MSKTRSAPLPSTWFARVKMLWRKKIAAIDCSSELMLACLAPKRKALGQQGVEPRQPPSSALTTIQRSCWGCPTIRLLTRIHYKSNDLVGVVTINTKKYAQ